MTSPFRHAIRSAPRETWLDRLAVASLEAADAKFYSTNTEPLLTVAMQAREVDTWDTARISLAVQDATAKLGHLIQDPRTNSAQARRAYREAAPLIPRGQAGGKMFFGFPSPTTDSVDEPLFSFRVSTLTERAAVDLIGMLPRSEDDDEALDAVLARRVTERSALNDLAQAVKDVDAGLELEFRDAQGRVERSVLLHDQAVALQDSLKESRMDRREITVTGMLDGMRTQRRIFYLLEESGREISGGVDSELLPEVRSHIGELVTATVEEVTRVEQSGRRSRPSHRLLKLVRPTSLI
ncbi:MAG: hypothetical protein J7503_00755 [Cellulomonas iranensis]|uniref:hypothetical protein n=1 Tax=Cellulomonas iranensis TaxID=76862 RepID=UPI001B096081|nr:hypothetical protein [Cellulomonas iranensis]MBO9567325.1 hypothetical protein [Cellulomonas iranensis]